VQLMAGTVFRMSPTSKRVSYLHFRIFPAILLSAK